MNCLKAAADLFYPPKCVVCRTLLEDGASGICGTCRAAAAGTAGEKRGDWFSGCVFALRYEGDVRESIQRFKFQGCGFYSRVYGALLAETIKNAGIGFDVLTYVPVSAKRRRERGYDQAERLCRETGKVLGAACRKTLVKPKNNPAQSGLDSAERRRKNVKGAYTVPDPETVRGKRILLIDDIVTTGSTLSECSRTLLQAGAESVWCAALAGTEL